MKSNENEFRLLHNQLISPVRRPSHLVRGSSISCPRTSRKRWVLYVFVLAVFYHSRSASSSTRSSIVSQEDVQHTCSLPNCLIILSRRYQQAAKAAWRGARNEVAGHRFEARSMQARRLRAAERRRSLCVKSLLLRDWRNSQRCVELRVSQLWCSFTNSLGTCLMIRVRVRATLIKRRDVAGLTGLLTAPSKWLVAVGIDSEVDTARVSKPGDRALPSHHIFSAGSGSGGCAHGKEQPARLFRISGSRCVRGWWCGCSHRSSAWSGT